MALKEILIEESLYEVFQSLKKRVEYLGKNDTEMLRTLIENTQGPFDKVIKNHLIEEYANWHNSNTPEFRLALLNLINREDNDNFAKWLHLFIGWNTEDIINELDYLASEQDINWIELCNSGVITIPYPYPDVIDDIDDTDEIEGASGVDEVEDDETDTSISGGIGDEAEEGEEGDEGDEGEEGEEEAEEDEEAEEAEEGEEGEEEVPDEEEAEEGEEGTSTEGEPSVDGGGE